MAFNRSWHSSGTASVNAASTNVTGSGSTWLSSGIREGDLFWSAGLLVPIAAVNTNTSLTLTNGWPGSNLAGADYKIIPANEGTRTVVASRSVLDKFTNGNLASIADLVSAADKIPYFTGAGTSALADFKAWARSLLGLTAAAGKIPVMTSSTAAAMRDIVGTVSQSGGVPTGAIVERGSTANGEFVRFADGTQICSHTLPTTSIALSVTYAGAWRRSSPRSWSFPATFAVAPIALGALHQDTLEGFVGTTSATTSIAYFVTVGPSPVTVDLKHNVMAIGRWF